MYTTKLTFELEGANKITRYWSTFLVPVVKINHKIRQKFLTNSFGMNLLTKGK